MDKGEAEVRATGGRSEGIPAKSIYDGKRKGGYGNQNGASQLPTEYDSRKKGYVSPVKDQGEFGICWSFATISAIESSILAHNKNITSVDLSERHLAYFSYHLEPDNLGNTKGDTNIPKGDAFGDFGNETYLGSGGNSYLATATLISGIGAVDEKYARMGDLKKAYGEYITSRNATKFHNDTALKPSLARSNNSWYVTGAKRIAMIDRDAVKQAIMEYGGVATPIFFPTGKYGFLYNS